MVTEVTSPKKLSSEEETEIAGAFDPQAVEALITEENQIHQTQEVPAPIPVSEKGSVRLLSVLVAVGCVLGIGAAVWFLMFGQNSTRTRTVTRPTPTPTVTASAENPNDQLKAELAFSRQRQQVEAANQKEEAAQKQPGAKKTGEKKQAASSSKPTVSEEPPARSRYRETGSASFSEPRQTYQSSRFSPAAPSLTERAVPSETRSSPPKVEDPFALWDKLAGIGQTSFGQTASETQQVVASKPAIDTDESSGIPVVTINLKQKEQVDAPEVSTGEAGILNRGRASIHPSPQEILIGTAVAARVKVPIAWAGSSDPIGRGAIELTEPLRSSEGTVVFPAGTLLVTQAEPIRSRQSTQKDAPVALANVKVVGAVLQTPTGIQQVPITADAMSVQAEDGGPIQAILVGKRPPKLLSGDDLLLALVGGISKAGEVMNRPQTSSTSSVVGGFGSSTSTTTTNPDPNMMGALAEGGLVPVTEIVKGRISARDRDAEDQRRSFPTYFVVPKDVPVVVVVQSFLRME